MKYLSECDLLIYDLHAGNPRDVDLALAGKSLVNLTYYCSFEETYFRRREDFDIDLIIDGMEQNSTQDERNQRGW